MKYNKNEVTGKMRDRIILQNVNRSRSLTGFASESWADVATIWAFAESKLPGSNETIIEGKNTAKNICDFTIRYISSITEESRVVFKNKIYQVKNIKISHDRRFISFQGVYYDSYSTVFGLQFCSASLLAQSSLSAALMRVIKYQASLNAFGSVSADIALVKNVASSLNAFGTLTGDITFVQNMQAALNGTAALSGGINFVQKPEASLNAFGSLVSDLKIGKTFESSLNANGTLVSDATIAKNLASSLTSSNSLAASALVSKLASASLTGAGTMAANLTVVIAFDSDAQAFFNRVTTAGGTLSTTEQNAIDTLVKSLKANGLWTNMKAIYPMVGASAASCAQNLKSASFTATFTAGWTFASTGATPNGTSAFMDTGLNDDTQLSLNNAHISIYSRTDRDGLFCDIGIAFSNSDINIFTKYSNVFYPRIHASNNGINNSISSLGLFISNRVSFSEVRAFQNNSLKQINNTSSAKSNYNIIIGAVGGATIRFYSPRENAFATIGDGLTDTEAANLYTAVQSFQTSLSRQV